MQGCQLRAPVVATCCALLVVWGSQPARSSAREVSDMRDKAARILDCPRGPYEVSRAPAHGQRLKRNPPVFVWLPVEGLSDYLLQYSQAPDFQDASTVTVKKN